MLRLASATNPCLAGIAFEANVTRVKLVRFHVITTEKSFLICQFSFAFVQTGKAGERNGNLII